MSAKFGEIAIGTPPTRPPSVAAQILAVQPDNEPVAFTPSHKLSSVVNLVNWLLMTRLPGTEGGAAGAPGAGAGAAGAAGAAGLPAAVAGAGGVAGFPAAGAGAAGLPAAGAGVAGLPAAGAGVAGACAKAVIVAPESAQR